jgi:choline-sulfatase
VKSVPRRLLLAFAFLSGACGQDGTPRPKNLLILCVDTLRADELGAYGKAPSVTPALDRLASESVVFERAHTAASWTLPSIGSVFTSFFPSTTGLWNFDSRLADGFPTLAERFQAAGFDTYGIASHDYFKAKYGLLQGFDGFDSELAHPRSEAGWVPVTSPQVSLKAVQWLERRAQSGDAKPWFLFVHFFDPHVPYLDHEAARLDDATRGERERYRSEIAFTDRHVGAVLEKLERAGLARDTAVLFFSDHGESFLEHGKIEKHSYGLYEEELRVPLVLRVPGVAPRRVAEFVRTVDLLPTLLALFGLDDEHGGEREGVSLVPLLTGQPAAIPPQLSEIRLKDEHHANALVRGRYKLYEDVSGKRFGLFDLETDPREEHDLSSEQPALRAELEAELRTAIHAAEAKGQGFGTAGKVELSPDELRHLEDLGYGGADASSSSERR